VEAGNACLRGRVSELRPNRYSECKNAGCQGPDPLAQCQPNDAPSDHHAPLHVSVRCHAGQVVDLGVRFP